jgi:hypothetical protein
MRTAVVRTEHAHEVLYLRYPFAVPWAGRCARRYFVIAAVSVVGMRKLRRRRHLLHAIPIDRQAGLCCLQGVPLIHKAERESPSTRPNPTMRRKSS